MSKGLACIVCDQSLESVFARNQPLDGLSFSTQGAYGSSVFDPMDGSSLEINICDACLCRAGQKGQVLVYEPPQVIHKAKSKLWRDTE